MHICLPDTREVKPAHGSAYVLYNVHVDGLYHCSLRFKQLLHLHQALLKKFTNQYNQLPIFPPKKLLPLTASQVEDRRVQLEKYLQNISQDKAISNSSIFNLFLLEAQRESTRIRENQVHLDVELVNGQKIRLPIITHDSTDAVLTAICRALGLNDQYHAYFCLCLCGYDVVRDKLIIKRRLSFFESPYVTLQMAIQQQEQLQSVLSGSNYNSNQRGNSNCRCLSCISNQQSINNINNNNNNSTCVPLVGSSSDSYQQLGHYNNNTDNLYKHQTNNSNSNYNQFNYYSNQTFHRDCFRQTTNTTSKSFVTHRILLRKSYWDPIYDTYLLNDQQALNLLFIQTVYDIKHSLIFVGKDIYHQLESLLANDSKLEYILLARTLKYYNYVHFEPCLSDYPRPKTKVMISIGSKELNMRVLKVPNSFDTSSNNSNNNKLIDQRRQQSPTNEVSNVSEQNTLYCTSSLAPGAYHLMTKDDIVEEEYSFKVPLIRCWRLTSLEALNCNNNSSSHNIRSSSAYKSSFKRKSLSLFNSVVGGNGTTSNKIGNDANGNDTTFVMHDNDILNESTSSINASVVSSGSGGNSLMAELANYHRTVNDDNGNYICQNSYQSHHYCQHENQHCEQHHDQQQQTEDDQTQFSQYELSFEYLISKDQLKWITISSDQAIFISVSLQGVVDELVSKRDGRTTLFNDIDPATRLLPSSSTSASLAATSPSSASSSTMTASNQCNGNQNKSFTYLFRNGSHKLMNTNNQQLIDKFGTTLGYSPMNPNAIALARQRQLVRSSTLLSLGNNNYHNSNHGRFVSSWFSEASGISGFSQHSANTFEIPNMKKAPSPIINDAFEGVTNDDDL